MCQAKSNATSWGGWSAAAVVAVGLFAMPGQAKAGDNWSFQLGIGNHHPVRTVSVHTVAVEPVYGPHTLSVRVEPQYTVRSVAVEIPAVVEYVDEPVYDHHGRIVGYRRVQRVIRPARIEHRTERVLVGHGHHGTVSTRVIVDRPIHRTVRHGVTYGHRRSGTGISFGFDYSRHRDHKRPAHRRLNRAFRAARRH